MKADANIWNKEATSPNWWKTCTLMKEIKEDMDKCKHILYSLVERIDIVKMFILYNVISWFIAIPIKTLKAFFEEIEKQS